MPNELDPTAPARLDLDIVIWRRLRRSLLWPGIEQTAQGKKECRRVAIVSNQNYLVFQPMLAEVAGGSLSPRHVVNPIRLLCHGIRVLKGEIRSARSGEERDFHPHRSVFVRSHRHLP